MQKKLKLTPYQLDSLDTLKLPLFCSPVKAGFPSPADDHIEQKLDLNQFLIQHPAATFFVRVDGDSMKGAGINDRDILIVDRALSPKSGQIVVAILDGEFTVKRVKIEGKQLFLTPENPRFPLIEVTEDMDFQVWGVVTYTVHACTP